MRHKIKQASLLITILVCSGYAGFAVGSVYFGSEEKLTKPIDDKGISQVVQPVNSDVPVDVSNDAPEQPPLTDDSNENVVPVSANDAVVTQVVRERRVGDLVIDEDGNEYPVQRYTTMAMPNDQFASQWWVNTMRLPEAWDIGYGSHETLLAIIDTGFALEHEEFAGRWYTNSAESGSAATENQSKLNCTGQGRSLNKSCNLIDDNLDGVLDNETGVAVREGPSLYNCSAQGKALNKSCNLIDDDGNGLVDDVRGWDFSNSYPSAQAGKTNPDGSGTQHGTMVAGVAAANGNNAVGIAGVDWHTKILPIQALDDDGYGDTITVSRAIRYASDQGADVISLSLGSSAPDAYLRQAIAYAIAKGSIIVASSGNEGCDCISYPARYEEVVAVGASDSSDLRASFSNYGSALDVLAPGVGLRSSVWAKTNGISSYASNVSGTSFSTPLVAGLLTAMKSHQPDATQNQLISALTERVNRLNIGSTTIKTATQGFGRVDASSAMVRVANPLRPAQLYTFSPISGGNVLGSYEPAGQFNIVQCEQGIAGSSTIYKLTKGQSSLYTISLVERYKAIASGYTAAALGGNYCMDLPTDLPSSIRVLSIQREFENQVSVKN